MIANKYRLAAAKGMFERPQGEDSLEPKRIMFLSTEGFLTERCYFVRKRLFSKSSLILEKK